ncbi:hypothetical protein BI362_03035 [Streptococcus parauberis]|nr:hypothetical protein BI362_03035 [Streptococcus parauberis]QBX18262.1 hypothetical protein Javan407_0029 [Streptococcus phage Javan407]
MNEELGVLVVIGRYSWELWYLINSFIEEWQGYPVVTSDIRSAHHCTRKEAEQFPQFEFVPLSELEDLK